MKLRAFFGTREDVRHESADNRTNDPEPDRPQKTHVHVHERFRSPPRNQTNDDVPNQMKHNDVSSFEFRIAGYRGNAPKSDPKLCLRVNLGAFFYKLTQTLPTLSPSRAFRVCRLEPVGPFCSSLDYKPVALDLKKSRQYSSSCIKKWVALTFPTPRWIQPFFLPN